ncbi:MAG: hypothetical protein KBC00_01245 [Candidatus Levybacteria bacterium]|nr:hypothetical protein [Candidatus Levybacteria bacterium]MBP9814962.1 hypothetical protein [Candidatus Levybacteria bacterium]
MKETYSGPQTLLEQPEVTAAYANDRDLSHELAVIKGLHSEMLAHLTSSEIEVLQSDARIKSTDRLLEKIENPLRKSIPILDLYALQLVVNSSDVFRTLKLIRKKWPMPKEFPWGIRTARMGKNPWSHPDYQAVHMNFVFNADKIAEAKLFTPEQYQIEQNTRVFYENNRGLLK